MKAFHEMCEFDQARRIVSIQATGKRIRRP